MARHVSGHGSTTDVLTVVVGPAPIGLRQAMRLLQLVDDSLISTAMLTARACSNAAMTPGCRTTETSADTLQVSSARAPTARRPAAAIFKSLPTNKLQCWPRLQIEGSGSSSRATCVSVEVDYQVTADKSCRAQGQPAAMESDTRIIRGSQQVVKIQCADAWKPGRGLPTREP